MELDKPIETPPAAPVDTYVYEGVEVTLTGRVAAKEKKMSSGKIIRDELLEVTPVKKPGVPVWRKWVKAKDLFKVASSDDAVEQLDNILNK